MSVYSGAGKQALNDNGRDTIQSDEQIRLSDCLVLHPNKLLTEHGNVWEGFITSEIVPVHPCAIKFSRSPEQATREIETLQKLGPHTHVISLMTSGTYRDVIAEHRYIAIEQCHKLNLRQILFQRKETIPVYDVSWALNFCKQIINGMIFVHENLIIHKDLKPSNILLTHDLMNIKIADFGSSQEVKSPSSKVFCPTMFGTLGYRPPESFGGSYASLKSDVFSLGALFYFLLSNGESPFGEESDLWEHNTKHGSFDLSALKVQNPIATKHLLKLMLDKDKRRRPSISMIANHPSWNRRECILEFHYGSAEEEDDAVVNASKAEKTDRDSAEDFGTRLFIEAFTKWKHLRREAGVQSFEILSPPKEISNSILSLERFLFEGIWTDFYKGTWKYRVVCIERLAPFDPSAESFFKRKRRVLTDLRHQNVICLLATTIDEPRRLVLEFSTQGNFHSYLIRSGEGLSDKDRYNFCLQIADGMSYIARKNYIHGSLCAEGILVGKHDVLKISQFRFTHQVGETFTLEDWKPHLRARWAAPEVILSGSFSQKSDVWSFGVVLYEIFSNGYSPYKRCVSDRSEILSFLSAGFRLEMPQHSPGFIYQEMQKCWEWDRNKRPVFSEIQPFFRELIDRNPISSVGKHKTTEESI